MVAPTGADVVVVDPPARVVVVVPVARVVVVDDAVVDVAVDPPGRVVVVVGVGRVVVVVVVDDGTNTPGIPALEVLVEPEADGLLGG